uniref:hypothetical protein n=1 Tax=Nocardia brasiliensis TaxID=37326 RepID=UPI002453E4D2
REHINLPPAYPDSRISVDTFRLPAGVAANALYTDLGEVGVHVLPGPYTLCVCDNFAVGVVGGGGGAGLPARWAPLN